MKRLLLYSAMLVLLVLNAIFWKFAGDAAAPTKTEHQGVAAVSDDQTGTAASGHRVPGGQGQGQGTTYLYDIDFKNLTPISPYIFGVNPAGSDPRSWDAQNKVTMYRLGGNRMTAYNWVNNLSHAGKDYRYENDMFLCGNYAAGVEPYPCDKPGAVYKSFLSRVFGRDGSGLDASALITIPIAGYVASKISDGDVCPQGALQDDGQCSDQNYLSTYFKRSVARKPTPLTMTPDPQAPEVYQDEFVHWLSNTFPKAWRKNRRIFYELDNEPALWADVHSRIRPTGGECVHGLKFSEALARNLEYAAMIKRLDPEAIVFGPVSYGWYEMTRMQGTGKCEGLADKDFYDWYLEGVARANREQNAGKPLIDVLDFHWYPEIKPEGESKTITDQGATGAEYEEARLDAPRSLWDPSYVENSWITKANHDEALELFPRLKRKIAAKNPGMKLAVSEYNYGGESDITGALAEADILGIFAKEGIFAASFWPLGRKQDFIWAALKAFRNYDGKGSGFGNLMAAVETKAPKHLSVYASTHSEDSKSAIFVIINKKSENQRVRLRINHGPQFHGGKIYLVTSKNPTPVPGGELSVAGSTLDVPMPPRSIATIEVR